MGYDKDRLEEIDKILSELCAEKETIVSERNQELTTKFRKMSVGNCYKSKEKDINDKTYYVYYMIIDVEGFSPDEYPYFRFLKVLKHTSGDIDICMNYYGYLCDYHKAITRTEFDKAYNKMLGYAESLPVKEK